LSSRRRPGYRVDTSVWFETHGSVEAAIRREK